MRLTIILSFLLLSLNSFACENYEAQFVGYATVVDGINENGCELSIDFSLYNMHFFCPLLQEDLIQKKILVDAETCKLVNNSQISGILSWDIEKDIVSLEL